MKPPHSTTYQRSFFFFTFIVQLCVLSVCISSLLSSVFPSFGFFIISFQFHPTGCLYSHTYTHTHNNKKNYIRSQQSKIEIDGR